MKKWKKWVSAAILGSALALGSCTLDDVLGSSGGGAGPTLDDKVVMGLRKALEVGIDSSADLASRVNGYFAHKVIKILLPPEAEQALQAAEKVGALIKPFASELNAMQTLVGLSVGGSAQNAFKSNLDASNTLLSDVAGLESIGDSVIKYMNRAAELAAPRSIPIFKKAITGMTITDGLALLNSADSTAATAYLDAGTSENLGRAYAPMVDSTLDLVPLTKYWGQFRTGYNSVIENYAKLVAFQESWNANTVVSAIPALQVDKLAKVDNQPIRTESLGAWTTDKALDGLFYLVGEEEREIRRDPLAYVRNLASDLSGLLKEVFGEIMKMGDRP